MVKAFIHPVGDGPVCEQGREAFHGLLQDLVFASHIQKGRLLSGEGGSRRVLTGGTASYSDVNVPSVFLLHFAVGSPYFLLQVTGAGCSSDQIPYLFAPLGQILHIVRVQAHQSILDPLADACPLYHVPVCFRSDGEPGGNIYPLLRQTPYHLTKRGVLTADESQVFHSNVFKPLHEFHISSSDSC